MSSVPSFDGLWNAGHFAVPRPNKPKVLSADYRVDPEQHLLKTPLGRIELFSSIIWLRAAEADELRRPTNQLGRQLHSQLYQALEDQAPATVSINTEDVAVRAIEDGSLACQSDYGAVDAETGTRRAAHGRRDLVAACSQEPGLETNGRPTP